MSSTPQTIPAQAMNKHRLELVLKGQAPDVPPHFELVFQLEKEFFGLDREAVHQHYAGQPSAQADASIALDIDMRHRLVDELGWAAVDACFGYIDPMEAITRLKNELGSRALVFAFNGEGVFWMPPAGTDQISPMDFTVMLCTDPDQAHQLARKKCEASKELARRQAGAGVDFIIINSDFGYNQGPFISPEQFAEYVTPYLTEIVAEIHSLGLPVILHSDGNLNLILDQLHSTGLDGYQSVDPQGGMEIEQVRTAYPDWILMGNVPCNLLQDVEEDQIRAAVGHCMRHGGPGKRYIFSTSNCIFKGMPPESYRIMLDEYHRLCQQATAQAG